MPPVRNTPEFAGALTRALFAGLKFGRNRMAVFLANSDETGVADPRGEFIVGGYIQAEDYWGSFAEDWQRKVLDGSPQIPYLHMNEIRRPEWRTQHKISNNDAERRISEAVLLLSGSEKPLAATSVIMRSDLEDVVQAKSREYRKKLPVGIDEPDYFCFMAYATAAVGQVVAWYPDAKRVDFVVSKKGKITTRLKSFHEEMKRIIDPPYRDLIGELKPATMEERIPLQAADLLLWHMQRHYAKTLDQVDQRRLGILVEDLKGNPHEWTRSELGQMTSRLFENFT
jgi:hypothetical protein